MIARTVALFFGAFGLVNFLLDRVVPGFDANLWWIDFRILPGALSTFALLFTIGGLLTFACCAPRRHSVVGRVTRASLWFFAAFVVENIVQYYALLFVGMIRSAFPVPLSLFLLAPVFGMLRASERPPALFAPGRRGGRLANCVQAAVVFGALVVLFPLAQMICFGGTDYRRPADVVVVFGARAYSDGRMSTALYDRTRTAVEMYRAGLVARLFFSGGHGDGDVHEVEAMQNYALANGVDARDILLDRDGLDTQATVDNSVEVLRRAGYDRVLAVSQFYHLPRVKLTYLRAGLNVYTVPAAKSRLILKLPLFMVREVAAFWYYYLGPLRTVGESRGDVSAESPS